MKNKIFKTTVDSKKRILDYFKREDKCRIVDTFDKLLAFEDSKEDNVIFIPRCEKSENCSIEIKLTNFYKIKPSSYRVQTNSENMLNTWIFEGSTDGGNTWKSLRKHENEFETTLPEDEKTEKDEKEPEKVCFVF